MVLSSAKARISQRVNRRQICKIIYHNNKWHLLERDLYPNKMSKAWYRCVRNPGANLELGTSRMPKPWIVNSNCFNSQVWIRLSVVKTISKLLSLRISLRVKWPLPFSSKPRWIDPNLDHSSEVPTSSNNCSSSTCNTNLLAKIKPLNFWRIIRCSKTKYSKVTKAITFWRDWTTINQVTLKIRV